MDSGHYLTMEMICTFLRTKLVPYADIEDYTMSKFRS